MKKCIAIVLVLCFALTLACSCIKQPQLIEQVETVEELSERVGFKMEVPSSAKYTTFSIIEKTTAEARFTFNSFIFIYRGSVLLSGNDLHEKGDKFISTNTLELDDRTVLTVNFLEDGSRLVTWYYGNTNYSLFTQKSVSDDVFLELCDLIVK